MRDIEAQTTIGGWRCLCAAVMLDAANVILRQYHLRPGPMKTKSVDEDVENAWSWIAGGQGAITFEDCCASLGIDPDRARSAIRAKC